MKKVLMFCALLLLFRPVSQAQSSVDSLRAWQQQYKADFLKEAHSPLTATDTGYIRFFPYSDDAVYRAKVKLLHSTDTVVMATHSGKTKSYRPYAILRFTDRSSFEHYSAMRSNHVYHLHIYQSVELAKDSAYKDYLFLPFTDFTNGKTTYGGGRYLDLKIGDIKNGRVIIDFNKAYNPYCAYKEGYNCPIPPRENSLGTLSIMAGEMLFANSPAE